MTTQTTPKIAIITGGSRGLGRNTVLSFAKHGVDSIITYNSNREAAEKVVGLVREGETLRLSRQQCWHLAAQGV